MGAFAAPLLGSTALPKMKIESMEVFTVQVSQRGNWLFVRLKTDNGVTGLGEASHGILGTAGDRPMRESLAMFFEMVRGESPFAVEQFRKRGWAQAKSGRRRTATAFSAIEQALWDCAGKALGVPAYDLLGGKLYDHLDVYGNLNRATNGVRDPNAFADNARRVIADGFHYVKGAPFDSVPRLSAPRADVDAAIENGIKCVEAMREAIGPEHELLIDCHSHFDVSRAIEVARRLEPQKLYWYEEPVDPERLEETIAIGKGIKQRMSGGEVLFGKEGFAPLCRTRALSVIMPDVKHCGGLLEGRKIAAVAELDNVAVSPHNPSGPVATAASVQLCAGLSNVSILEFAWGEVPWRAELINPPEQFVKGRIRVPDAPGFGIELNDKEVARHAQGTNG